MGALRRAAALVCAFLCVSVPVQAQNVVDLAVLSANPCAQLTLKADFTADGGQGLYCLNGVRYSTLLGIPGSSYSRTGVEYAANSAGLLVPFAANVPAITDLGLQIWEPRTDVVLWNRDLTNAAWVKTSTTAALDQVGVDGVANSASSVTATGTNGTILQTITLASSAREACAWVKRITGVGTVSMTMDNVTFTTITLTTAWQSFSIPNQTITNPVVGFKLATSGNKIAVDFVQNQGGTFCGPSILNTSAASSRGAPAAFITFTPPAQGTLVAKLTWPVPAASLSVVRIIGGNGVGAAGPLYLSGTNSAGTYNGSVALGATIATSAGALGVKVGMTWNPAGRSVTALGAAPASDAGVFGPNVTALYFGSTAGNADFVDATLNSLTVLPDPVNTSGLQAATR